MKLYLMRHCEAVKHPLLRYTLDSLTDNGVQEARDISKKFNRKLDYLVSSPSLRALRTAEIIANERNMKVITNPNWMELSRGIYADRPYEEFLEVWSKGNYDYDYIPPQGESVNQGRRRIVKGVEDILNLDGDVLCTTHAGLISNLLMMLF